MADPHNVTDSIMHALCAVKDEDFTVHPSLPSTSVIVRALSRDPDIREKMKELSNEDCRRLAKAISWQLCRDGWVLPRHIDRDPV